MIILSLAGFGLPEDTELLRLRGGFMLKELVNNINDVIKNSTTTKYFAYSGVSYKFQSLHPGRSFLSCR